MTNTPFSKQVDIIADLYLNHKDANAEFVRVYDLGCVLAACIALGGVERDGGINEYGAGWIGEAFEALLESQGLDIYGEYDSLAEIAALANAEG